MSYSDLSAGVESLYAENLYKKCAIDGYSKTVFGKYLPVTKAELSKIVLVMFDLGTAKYSKLYDDVSAKDPNAPYLLRAAKLGLIKGQSINSKKLSLLKPNDHIVKAEALQMILSAKGVDLEGYNKGVKFVDVASYDWFYKAVAFAKNESLVNTYEFIFPLKGQVGTLFEFPRLLSFKDTGKDVENLKSIMMQLDYYVGRINSTYDQELADAVKVYQKAKGITLSGNLDKDTRSKLLKEYLHPKTVYSFRPFDLITREEVARIVYLVDRLPASLLKDNVGQVLGAQYSPNAHLINVVKELFISTMIWLQ